MKPLVRHKKEPALRHGKIALLGVALVTTALAQSPVLSKARLTGPREVVFNTTNQCELNDIPDAPTRAFRDASGTVHLISASSVLYQNLGPTLDSVTHSCQRDHSSKGDPNPADFNDQTWLDSFYSIQGTNRVVALGHMEYHGWAHHGECHDGVGSVSCWYNAETYLFSDDGGYRFKTYQAPDNFVLGVPYQYIVDQGPEGYSIDSNVIKSGDWYYAVASGWDWPPSCYGTNKCLVHGGNAPIRTSDITDPSSWRAWNGHNFGNAFVDPYLGPVSHPREHILTPIPNLAYANGISYHPASGLFIATLIDPFNAYYGPLGVYLTTSPDMVNWTQPVLLATIAEFQSKDPKPPSRWFYGYASLLDPQSTDPNFATIGDEPYLYFVRSDNGNCCYVRVLFRQQIKLTWK